jgi:hypothetical protein
MKKPTTLLKLGAVMFPIVLLVALWGGVFADDTPSPDAIFNNKAILQGAAGDISLDDYITEETGTADSLGNCRYGASQLGGVADSPYISKMNLGWKNNFNVSFDLQNLDTANYAPTIRFEQIDDGDGDKTNDRYVIKDYTLTDSPTNGLGYQVTQHPGTLWLVGNEPDRAVIQDALYPQVYARAYHDVYHFIKARDPSADIAIAGLVQVSENRLEYLTIVWDTYKKLYGVPMPVDVWNMHAYAFPERTFANSNIYAWVALGTNPNNALYDSGGNAALCGRDDVRCIAEHDDIDLLKEQITNMRRWMKARGQQQKPLIISEYGLLFPYVQDTPTQCYIQDEFGGCFTEQRNIDFAKNSFNLLESYVDPALGYAMDDNRMVQQWLWFATRATEIEKYALVNRAGTALTGVGRAFRDQVVTQPLERNLRVHSHNAPHLDLMGGTTGTGKVFLRVMNNGTQAILAPVTITLYSNASLTNVVGSVVLNGGIRGCTTDLAPVALTWPNLSKGVHRYWVKIDSNNQFAETSETDNVITGAIYVDQPTIFLPAIRR